MKKILLSALLAASCLSVSTVSFAQTDADRLENLETRLMGLERRATSGASADGATMLADHEARLQALETETSRVYGKAEEVSNAIEVLAKKVEMIAKDLELRLQDMEKAISEGATAKPAAPTAAAKGGAKKRNDSAPAAPQVASTPIPAEISADDMYQKSYDMMKAGSYADAEAWFKEFIARNPQHARSENAYYWLGEVYLVQNRAEEALVAFRDGIRAFPSGNKTADSLLKMGVAFEQIGKPDLAKTTWEKLVREFPNSASANSAKQRLSSKN